MLGMAAWRGVRLVVDTGLHACGWSRARALGFALAHTPLPESFMAAEIDRYIAALGYLVSQRELLRLRTHAQARLGAAFDLRDFHAAMLDHGSLPLPVLSRWSRPGWRRWPEPNRVQPAAHYTSFRSFGVVWQDPGHDNPC
jgi:uncharacterized protein (DUF885 family)